MKGARYFEVKKTINHELETHGYGGAEEEDGECDDSVGVDVWPWMRKRKERIRVL